MTVGIDLSPLQGPHRMRGIGYTLINFINHIPEHQRRDIRFIFYMLPYGNDSSKNPIKLLDLDGMDYEVRELTERHRSNRSLPGKLNILVSAYNQLIDLRDLYFGDSRIKDFRGVDVFLQTDQSQSLPRKHGLKKALVVYDLIPYVLEWDYLWSYKTARTRGFSRKAALRVKARRSLYMHKLKANVRRANMALSISEATKKDFLDIVNMRENRVKVTPLGVTEPSSTDANPTLQSYGATSWGYLPSKQKFDSSVPFLLFVGGADRRRKLDELVTAFNQIRAEGRDIKLVLTGDSMKGPENISTEEIQYALKTSSYIDDIVFMGFVDDATRNWLYDHALAFVFPSKYEGFGLPVLEAMIRRCPVVSYRNDATLEVAGSAPIYAKDADELRLAILRLLDLDTKELDTLGNAGFKQAKKYSWEKTSQNICDELSRLV